MLYLYLLLILSLAALLWAAWAIRKHVRAHQDEESQALDGAGPAAISGPALDANSGDAVIQSVSDAGGATSHHAGGTGLDDENKG